MPEQAPLQKKNEIQSDTTQAQKSDQATPASAHQPLGVTSPALLGTRNVAQLQRSLGNRQIAQMLNPHPAIAQRMVIQRELTKSAFIEDTTWSFLCNIFHGRRGNAEVRGDIETALDTFESTDQGAEALRALKVKLMDARGKLEMADSTLGPVITKLAKEITTALDSLGAKATVYNLDEFPRAKELITGIDLSADTNTKLGALKAKFAAINWFYYEMSGGGMTEVLKGSGVRGDCRTLADLFVWVAVNALGVPASMVKTVGYGKDYLVRGGGQVTNAGVLTGNVDDGGGQHWRFTSHSWVETAIGSIDLLFLAQDLDRSGWVDLTAKGMEGDKPWNQYGDVKIYRQNLAGITHRYTTDPTAALTDEL